MWFLPLNHGTCCSWAFVLLDTQGCLYPLDLEPIDFFFLLRSQFLLGFLVSFSLIQGPVVWCANTGRVGECPSDLAGEMAEDFLSCQNRLHHCDCDLSIGTAGNSGCPCPQGCKYCSRLFLRNLDKQVGCSSCTWKISCQLS